MSTSLIGCLRMLLKQLATDKDSYVRMEVARNSKIPIGILKQLLTDKVSAIGEAVARNSSTPLKILKRLAVDKIEEVRLVAISAIISLPESEWKK